MRRQLSFLIFLSFFQVLCLDSVWAIPSAHDLLQTAQNNTHITNNTHHLIYQTSTVIQKPGQAPTTIAQTTEIFKKKPNYLKIVITNSIQKSQMISVGDGYLYVQDPTSGKYQPVKAPFPIDPFQTLSNSVTDFDSASSQAVTDPTDPPGGHYEVTVRGGVLPKNVDHATLKIDPTMNVVTHMEGDDPSGNKVLIMNATYQKMGNTYHPQHTHTESHTKNFDVNSDMDVTTNEVDQDIPVSVFSIK
jgi:hypothetical protein